MDLYSEALKILDSNTVKYMVEQQQEELERKEKELRSKDQELQSKDQELAAVKKTMEQKDTAYQAALSEINRLKAQIEASAKIDRDYKNEGDETT